MIAWTTSSDDVRRVCRNRSESKTLPWGVAPGPRNVCRGSLNVTWYSCDRHAVARRRARLVKVALLDSKSNMPLQKLPESAAILVWPPVVLIDTLVSEWRSGSPSSSPPRPPVAGSSHTVLLIAVPPSCRLSFRPLCFQAP